LTGKFESASKFHDQREYKILNSLHSALLFMQITLYAYVIFKVLFNSTNTLQPDG